MRLSALWANRQERIGGQNPVANTCLEHWKHDGEPAQHYKASETFLSIVQVDGRNCFLRYIGADERDRAAIEQECQFVRWLHAQGVAVALPIAARNGDDVVTVDTSIGLMNAVLWTSVDGWHPPFDALDVPDFRRSGEALGTVHAASARYEGDVSARPTWQDHLDRTHAYIDPSQTMLLREWQDVNDALAALPDDRSCFGPVHSNFNLGNLMWDGDAIVATHICKFGIVRFTNSSPTKAKTHVTLTTIDWDGMSRMWFAADIAYAVSYGVPPIMPLDHPSIIAFLAGYRSRFALDDAMLVHIPLFMRLRALIEYGQTAWKCDLPREGNYPSEWYELEAFWLSANQRYVASLEARASNT